MPGPDRSIRLAKAMAAHGQELEAALAAYGETVRRLGSVKDRAHRLQLLASGTETLEQLPLSDSLTLNLRTLGMLFRRCSDFALRRFRIAGGRRAALLFLDGLVKRTQLEESVLRPLLYEAFPIQDGAPAGPVERLLRQRAIPMTQLTRVSSVGQVVGAILQGNAPILIDGESTALVADVTSWVQRSPEEPITESVIRGPREGFVETLQTNTALLRRRIRTPHLKLERFRLGHMTRTDVIVAYIDGIAPEPLVEEVRRRVGRIRIDGIVDTAYIEEFIEDEPLSPFPQVQNTERPDTVAAALLEGRVAILAENTPFALLVPVTLWQFFQASDDYYERWLVATALRGLRYMFLLVALLLPSLYVAVTTYHQEMIPTTLFLALAAARAGVPFPALVEALIMEVFFEVLREGGLRLPRTVGQAVTIVGALVIGQAAVNAGIVSAPLIMVVAITGIASFTMPRFSFGIAIRLLRFPMIFLAGALGLYGVALGIILIAVHLAGLRSFGVPYLAPVAPLHLEDWRDIFARFPIWARGKRPSMTGYPEPQRQPPRLKPGPPPAEEAGRGRSRLRTRPRAGG